MNAFALRLEEYRMKLGLTQQQVATKIGVSQQVYSRYESGERYPTIHRIPDIARVLELDLQILEHLIESN